MKNPNNLFTWLKRNCEYTGTFDKYGSVWSFYGKLNGYQVRTIDGTHLQFGHLDFDRWANSASLMIKIDFDSDIGIQINRAWYINAVLKDKGLMRRAIDKMELINAQICD